MSIKPYLCKNPEVLQLPTDAAVDAVDYKQADNKHLASHLDLICNYVLQK